MKTMIKTTIREYKGNKLVKSTTKELSMTQLKNLEKKNYVVTLMGNTAIADR